METVRPLREGQGVQHEWPFERDFRKPALIFTVGRSGSSLIANIFKEHGFWLGQTKFGDSFNPLGYFENRELKRRMLSYHGVFSVERPPPITVDGWDNVAYSVITKQGYRGGPWAFKTGVHYAGVWDDFDPTIIKVIRDRDAIVRSYERYGGVHRIHGPGFIDRGWRV